MGSLLKIRLEPGEEGEYIPGIKNITGMYLLIERCDTDDPGQPGDVRYNRCGLTPCEAKVMDLVARGLADKEIAAILHKSDYTIKNQKKSIYNKMGVRNRVEAGRVWGRL